jgi:hypothetical protein
VGFGTITSAGTFVSATDIAAGNLSFVPGTGQTGSPYATFTFQVQDDGGLMGPGAADLDPTPRTMTVNVTTTAVTSISDMAIGDDTATRHQRSRIEQLQVTFDRAINVGASNVAAAFTLTRLDNNSAVILSVTWDATFTIATIRFVGGQANEFGRSLIDGNYSLIIDGSFLVDSNGNHVDADGDTIAGGTRELRFYRLFGDLVTSGNYHESSPPVSWRIVDNADFAAVRFAYGTLSGDPNYDSAFDADGDGDVDNFDLARMRLNYLRFLPEIP